MPDEEPVKLILKTDNKTTSKKLKATKIEPKITKVFWFIVLGLIILLISIILFFFNCNSSIVPIHKNRN